MHRAALRMAYALHSPQNGERSMSIVSLTQITSLLDGTSLGTAVHSVPSASPSDADVPTFGTQLAAIWSGSSSAAPAASELASGSSSDVSTLTSSSRAMDLKVMPSLTSSAAVLPVGTGAAAIPSGVSPNAAMSISAAAVAAAPSSDPDINTLAMTSTGLVTNLSDEDNVVGTMSKSGAGGSTRAGVAAERGGAHRADGRHEAKHTSEQATADGPASTGAAIVAPVPTLTLQQTAGDSRSTAGGQGAGAAAATPMSSTSAGPAATSPVVGSGTVSEPSSSKDLLPIMQLSASIGTAAADTQASAFATTALANMSSISAGSRVSATAADAAVATGALPADPFAGVAPPTLPVNSSVTRSTTSAATASPATSRLSRTGNLDAANAQPAAFTWSDHGATGLLDSATAGIAARPAQSIAAGAAGPQVGQHNRRDVQDQDTSSSTAASSSAPAGPAVASGDSVSTAADPGTGAGMTQPTAAAAFSTPAAMASPQPTTQSLASAAAETAYATTAASQVGAALVTLTPQADGSSRLAVSLQPKDLGAVQIQVERHVDGAVHVVVAADEPATLRSLMTSQAHLHAALDAASVPTTNRHLSFELSTAASQTPATGGHATTSSSAEPREDTPLPQKSDGQTAPDMSSFRNPGQPDRGAQDDRRGQSGQTGTGASTDELAADLPPAFVATGRSMRSGSINITA